MNIELLVLPEVFSQLDVPFLQIVALPLQVLKPGAFAPRLRASLTIRVTVVRNPAYKLTRATITSCPLQQGRKMARELEGWSFLIFKIFEACLPRIFCVSTQLLDKRGELLEALEILYVDHRGVHPCCDPRIPIMRVRNTKIDWYCTQFQRLNDFFCKVILAQSADDEQPKARSVETQSQSPTNHERLPAR